MTRNTRPQRTPLQNRSVLGVKGKEPGFSYRIVNDVGDEAIMEKFFKWQILPKFAAFNL